MMNYDFEPEFPWLTLALVVWVIVLIVERLT